MKFVSLRTIKTKRAHQKAKSDKPSRGKVEPLDKPVGVPHPVHTFTELKQQIHDDLRVQHPEWIQPNGECPMCDSYEARLMELLETALSRSDESIITPNRAIKHGLI
jgi:hypothetical protein